MLSAHVFGADGGGRWDEVTGCAGGVSLGFAEGGELGVVGTLAAEGADVAVASDDGDAVPTSTALAVDAGGMAAALFSGACVGGAGGASADDFASFECRDAVPRSRATTSPTPTKATTPTTMGSFERRGVATSPNGGGRDQLSWVPGASPGGPCDGRSSDPLDDADAHWAATGSCDGGRGVCQLPEDDGAPASFLASAAPKLARPGIGGTFIGADAEGVPIAGRERGGSGTCGAACNADGGPTTAAAA